MKIAVTTTGDNLDAPLDGRFGRAASFLIFDTETETFTIMPNLQNMQAAQGAGVQAGQNVAGSGADALITGHVGPKAFAVLQAAGVKIYLADLPTVREALAAWREDRLSTTNGADRSGHWS